MLGLGGTGRGAGDPRVAVAEFAAEEIERETVALQGELGVVTVAFVAHERVGAVEFVPREIRAGRSQGGVDLRDPRRARADPAGPKS